MNSKLADRMETIAYALSGPVADLDEMRSFVPREDAVVVLDAQDALREWRDKLLGVAAKMREAS